MSFDLGRRTKSILSVLLLALGTAMLSYPLISYGVGHYNQRKLRQQWEKSEQAAPTEGLGVTVKEEKKQPRPKAGEPIAEMTIPDLHLRVMIVEGTSDSVLREGPGHFPDTALPGEPGNCCIAGHRNMFGSWFGKINRLSAGDKIILHRMHTDLEYRVVKRLVVAPSDTSVLKPTRDSALTLVTCTPVPKPTHRLVVVAKMSAGQ